MNLQLNCIHQYIETHASDTELYGIISKCQHMLSKHLNDKKKAEAIHWLELYKPWFEKHPFAGKFPIERIDACTGIVFYRIELDWQYDLYITETWIRIEVNDGESSKCRVNIDRDGIHKGCERDGCNIFDGLVLDPENVKYLVDFWNNVHLRMDSETTDAV